MVFREQRKREAAEQYKLAALDNADLHVNYEENNFDAGASFAIHEFAEKAFVAGAEWADANPKNQWINANEDSPEDGELVLAMVDNGRITAARAYSHKTCEKIYVQWDAEYIPLFGEHYTTHWMPIPNLNI